jgi:tetratricopeptide (TPR) repeat protein
MATYIFLALITQRSGALAQRAVETALRLRPEAGEAHFARAGYLYRCYLDYDHARTELALAQRTLPNSAEVLALMGYIDRRQSRWDESTRNLEKALQVDPRNRFILQQVALSYQSLRRYADMAAALDRALKLAPADAGLRVQRALVALEWRADPKPLHETIETIVAENPAAASDIADRWLNLALCERDAAGITRALAHIPANGIAIDLPSFPLSWCQGLVARSLGDQVAAQKAFSIARADVERTVREQPNYGPAFCLLGLIDAGLGRKEEAIREGRRAVELLPVTKDSVNGANMMKYLAVIYGWTGEKDLALRQITATLQVPADLSYGQLKLHPYWDPLRGDSRFEKIVASLAPKEANK